MRWPCTLLRHPETVTKLYIVPNIFKNDNKKEKVETRGSSVLLNSVHFPVGVTKHLKMFQASYFLICKVVFNYMVIG